MSTVDQMMAAVADCADETPHGARIGVIMAQLEQAREALYADTALMGTLEGALAAGDVSRVVIDLTSVTLRLIDLESTLGADREDTDG